MKTSKLINYLLNSNVTTPTIDPYYNNVRLLILGDKISNSKGLPLYRDYSRYQTEIRENIGSNINSGIFYADSTDINYPNINTNTDINVDSFIVIPNTLNYQYRLQEINTGNYISNINPTYLEIFKSGNELLSLTSDDFTFEISFYADELNLPWFRGVQTLFSAGLVNTYSGNIQNNTISSYGSYATNGYTLQIKGSDLYFVINGIAYKVNTNTLIKDSWYSVAVQRKGNNLETFLNNTKTNSYSVTFNQSFNLPSSVSDTFLTRMSIGADSRMYKTFNPVSYHNSIDTSFSGGISNFRFTKQIARYPNSFYSTKLPFIRSNNQNKLDTYYSDVLFNFPLNYDLFDYSSNLAAIENREQLFNTFIDSKLGYLYLHNKESYTSKKINNVLSNSEWTLEFYLTTFRNGIPDTKEYLNLYEWTTTKNIEDNYSSIDEKYNLIKLLGNDSSIPILQIDWNLYALTFNNKANYFSFSASADGETFLNYPSETNIEFNTEASPSVFVSKILPSNEIKFSYSGYYNSIQLSDFTGTIRSAYQEPNTHFAICRYNDTLHIYVNGVLEKSIPFNYNLYSDSSLRLQIGEQMLELLGTEDTSSNNPIAIRMGLGIKGIRLTNKARYVSTGLNDYTDIASLQPLPASINSFVPPRARILDIVKRNIDLSISTSEAEWFVYTSQPLENLTLSDFSLVATDGVLGAELISLIKETDYQYIVRANTGSNNGNLGLNFLDRKTIKYKDTNNFISSYIGELDYTGQVYIINKSNPVPILTSGSSPYILDSFLVNIKFDSAINQFDYTKIGLINATLTNLRLIDEVNKIYEFTINPISKGVVVVQALQGAGVTTSGLQSKLSAPLTRIYSDSFSILQLPLTSIEGLNDYSSARHLLSETVSNNTVFSNTIAPLGTTTSLYVNPVLEQSGAYLNSFNALGNTFQGYLNQDWTLEFFIRINSSSNKTAHIFSIEGANGFALVAKNGKLFLQRSIDNSSNLIPGFEISEIDTITYPAWNSNSFTLLEKYPYFAITKKGNVYRFYRNGKRIALTTSNITIDVTKGNLKLGYYQNRVVDTDYYLSNLRLTVGKALYTSYQFNVPGLPYDIPANIGEITEILNYISIYSTNLNNNIARTNDKIILKFNSIIELENIPIVQINNRTADITKLDYNAYQASITVLNNDIEGQVSFNISIENESSLPDRVFISTTNNTNVVIDNTPLTANIYSIDSSSTNNNYICFIEFSEEIKNFELSMLSYTNCLVSNLYRFSNSNKYQFNVTAIATGDTTIQLNENKVLDLAGNYNLNSNIFIQNVIVPNYIADSYFNNVICLLQPTNNLEIEDKSLSNSLITNTDVIVNNTSSPLGMETAMYFNGNTSSLAIELPSAIVNSSDYTIEFFIKVASSYSFRLAVPNILPASDVTNNSFTANWQQVFAADKYVVDISNNSLFNSFLPGYKQFETQEVSLDVKSNFATIDYLNTETVFKSKDAIILDLGKNLNSEKYTIVDFSLSDTFVKKQTFATSKNIFSIGNIETRDAIKNITVENNNNSNDISIVGINKGNIITGLISSSESNYAKLQYFLNEETVRLYKTTDDYSFPIVVEDFDTSKWRHIALVNSNKYLYLYIDGILEDKIKNISFSNTLDIGYSIGHFHGYMQGLRITNGIARYLQNFTTPILPYGLD